MPQQRVWRRWTAAAAQAPSLHRWAVLGGIQGCKAAIISHAACILCSSTVCRQMDGCVCVCGGGGVCMLTQEMHPANPSTIQSCDSPKYVVLEVCFCPMPGAQHCRDITGYSTVEDH